MHLRSPEVLSSLLNALKVAPEQIQRHFRKYCGDACKANESFSKSVTSHIVIFKEL